MSSSNTTAPGGQPARTRRIILAAVLTVVVLLAGFFVLTGRSGGEDETAKAGASSSPSESPANSPEPTAEAATTEPAPAPAEESPAGTEPAAPVEGAPAPAPSNEAERATQDREVAPPVEIASEVSAAGGVNVSVTEMLAVEGEAHGIGEIAGPSVRFTLSITNNTEKPIDLSSALATVEAGPDSLPCTELSGPGVAPFPETAAPGQTVTGTFVFLIPVEDRNLVSVYLSYSMDSPVAAFKGAVPTP